VTGLVPHWSTSDVKNLQRRVRATLSPQPVLTLGPAPSPKAPESCPECVATDHFHKAKIVGGYRLCLCPACPVLVLG
jgi:hypothetical protein